MKERIRHPEPNKAGFSLLELLMALTLFSIVLGLLFGMIQNSQKAWGHASSQLEQFEEARGAFETISRRLTDAVLNPYWGYDFPDGDTSKSPIGFSRQSELHFISGPGRGSGGNPPVIATDATPSHAVFFHGPFGVNNEEDWQEFATLLNGWGYYIDYVEINQTRPSFINESISNTGYRYRLMELRVPAEELTTYSSPASVQTGQWYKNAIENGQANLVTENVVALIIVPEAPEGVLSHPTDIAPNYYYNTVAYLDSGNSYAVKRSRHQLPPLLRFTMVVLDEPSAIKLSDEAGPSPPDLGLDELFVDATKYETDLAVFKESLLERGFQYRIFSTMVRLRNARWSETLPE